MIGTGSNLDAFTRRLAARAAAIPAALDRGLGRWAIDAHRASIGKLSGSGRPGAYPVPVRSGHLRRSEDYVLPGRSKHGVSARSGQAYLVNTAAYASVIHDRSGKFEQDAVDATRKGGMDAISAEIRKVLSIDISAPSMPDLPGVHA